MEDGGVHRLGQEDIHMAGAGVGHVHVVSGGVAALVEGVLQFGVEALRLGELIFEDNDATGRVQGVARVDEFAHTGGDAQLVARVAAVPAR